MADPVDDLLPLLGLNADDSRDDSESSDTSSLDSDVSHMSDSDGDHPDENRVVEEGRLEERQIFEARQKKKKEMEKKKKSRKGSDSSPPHQQIINFDQSLPSAHSYLGDDLEDVRGRTIFEENSVVTLPLLLLPSVVLVPGQVIPLQLYLQRLVAMVRRVADKDKTFGVINLSKTYDREDGQHYSTLGCTAEIFSMKDEMDEPSGISTVRVKARGRQRFRVISVKSEITGDLMGKVKILPEVSLTHALEGAMIPSHRRLMVPPPDDSDMIKTAVDRQGRVLTSVDLRKKNPVSKLYSANYTWWPPWVYRMYDISGKLLCCEHCQEEIASKKDVFSMCQEGPLGAFVNPGGYVHEMFTVLAVANLYTIGGSSTEHSWFPGYAWTIVQCRGCHSHMGWMFTATKKSLSPRKFWGLCRSTIKATFGSPEGDEKVKEFEGFIM